MTASTGAEWEQMGRSRLVSHAMTPELLALLQSCVLILLFVFFSLETVKQNYDTIETESDTTFIFSSVASV